MSGYPAYIRIQNHGKIPCRIGDLKLGGEIVHARLRQSSVSDNSIGGSLEGTRVIPGETLHFRLSGTENLIKRITSNGESVGSRIRNVVPMELRYRYEPEKEKLLKTDVKLVARKKWILLRVEDSTVRCCTV